MKDKPALGSTASFFRSRADSGSIERTGTVVYVGPPFWDEPPPFDASHWLRVEDYDFVAMKLGKLRFDGVSDGEIILRVDRRLGKKILPSWYYTFHYRDLLLIE